MRIRHAYVVAAGEFVAVFPRMPHTVPKRPAVVPAVWNITVRGEAYRMPMLMPGKLMPMPGPYTSGG